MQSQGIGTETGQVLKSAGNPPRRDHQVRDCSLRRSRLSLLNSHMSTALANVLSSPQSRPQGPMRHLSNNTKQPTSGHRENARGHPASSHEITRRHHGSTYDAFSTAMCSFAIQAVKETQTYCCGREASVHRTKRAWLFGLSIYVCSKRQYSQRCNAHQGIFDWGFQPQSQSSQAWSSATFYEGLPGNRGIYWVSSKAGSSKSTLMRFLVFQYLTTTSLKQFAGP